MNTQMELIETDYMVRQAKERKEKNRLHKYWKECLRVLPEDVFEGRHMRDTSGWSYAGLEFLKFKWLYRDGEMSKNEYERWMRFEKRYKRWDCKEKSNKEICGKDDD